MSELEVLIMRFIRMNEVKEKTGLSRTSIWRGIKAGTFPEPVPLGGRAIGFVEEEVEEWMDAIIASRDEASK